MPVRAHLCSSLLLLAIATEARPGHRIQPGSRDGTLAGLTHSECVPVDPSQCFIDRSQQTTVRLVQVDLEIHLGCLGRLVDNISLAFAWSTCRAYCSNRSCLDLTTLDQ